MQSKSIFQAAKREVKYIYFKMKKSQIKRKLKPVKTSHDGTRQVPLRVSFSRNISKTSASVSSGVPNTEKVMKARGRRPSALIVSRCLEPPMKHEARVFDMASQMEQ